MQAIILAGGFGTRLKSAVGHLPKPMAPIAGRPFLCWLLEYVARQGVTDAVLCVHYLPKTIRNYFGHRYAGINLHYALEEVPLGTGGAIKQALGLLDTTQPMFVLNGDSFVCVDYAHMLALHVQCGRALTIATSRQPDCSRYSLLQLQEGLITNYRARGTNAPGVISNGFYVLEASLFTGYELPESFSFEADFLAPHVPQLWPASFSGVEYFIDIGVPQDYARAQKEIPEMTQQAKAA